MKKLFIETYGCQMNVADSEVVASVMQMAGYETTEHEEEADAIFLNTCSIRENAARFTTASTRSMPREGSARRRAAPSCSSAYSAVWRNVSRTT